MNLGSYHPGKASIPRGHLSLSAFHKKKPTMPKLWRPNLFKRKLPWFMRYFRRLNRTTAKPESSRSAGVMKNGTSQSIFPSTPRFGSSGSGGVARGGGRGLARKAGSAR